MTPGTAKAKGRETEQMLCDWLRRVHNIPAERRRLKGSDDQGDVAGWRDVCVEVKSGARIDIAGWLAELAVEINNAGAETGFVAVRPKGRPDVGNWFAVLPLPTLVELLRAAGYDA